MQIVFLLSSLVLALCICTPTYSHDFVETSASTILSSSAEGAKTRIEVLTRTGKRRTVLLERDSTVAQTAKPRGIRIIGEIDDSVIILEDTYPSIPGGMAYCQAGEERFLRIISFSSALPEETLRIKLESCRDNIELASSGIEWLKESSTLRIHWLLSPSGKGTPEERTIRIGSDGRPG